MSNQINMNLYRKSKFYIFIFLSPPTNDNGLQNDVKTLTLTCCNLNNDVLYIILDSVQTLLKCLHRLDDSARTAVLLNWSWKVIS